jgi:hypothetical protein
MAALPAAPSPDEAYNDIYAGNLGREFMFMGLLGCAWPG